MPAASIVTDSNAYLDVPAQEPCSVIVIPNRIDVLGEVVNEPDITADRMFERLARAHAPFEEIRPTLLPPCPKAIEAALARASARSREILALHMSRFLSPTLQAVTAAAQHLAGIDVRVMDSHSASVGLGWLVQRALRASAQGQGLAQVSRVVAGDIPSFFVTFFAESMHYLERSACMDVSHSLLGAILDIKAMLIMEDGQLMPVEKVQTRTQLVDRLFEYIIEFSDIRKIGLMHHAYAAVVRLLRERLAAHDPALPVVDVPYPPSLAVHLGPKVIGVVIHEGIL